MVVVLILAAIFLAADAAGLVEKVTGQDIPNAWLYLGAFILFGITALYRLIRLQERLDKRENARRAIQAFTPFITSGNELLNSYGRPESPGLPWDWMIHYALPAINAWYEEVNPAISKFAPEFSATWNNDGNIYEHTNQKAASIQQLEGRLKRLGDIIRELRTQL